MRKNFFVLVAVCWLAGGSTVRVMGQAAAPVHRMDTALLGFFSGHWTGEGAFAGGGKIAADLSFSLSLDSCWVVYEHRDQAPNRYKATSMWGEGAIATDPRSACLVRGGCEASGTTGEFFAYIFDNFHGHRQLTGNGWRDGKLLISGQSYIPGVGLYFEHFLYARLSDTQFKMSYETSRDGIVWQLGDWLVFTKVADAGK